MLLVFTNSNVMHAGASSAPVKLLVADVVDGVDLAYRKLMDVVVVNWIGSNALTFDNRSSTARVLCLLLAAILFLLLLTEATSAASKQVMLLHSFGKEFKPWSEYAGTIREELKRQSPWPIDITEQSLITARSSDENPETPFVEYLRALFANRHLDLIVSIGAPAADFVQRQRQELFSTTPMVLTAVDQRRVN
jgi:hypothetical protein